MIGNKLFNLLKTTPKKERLLILNRMPHSRDKKYSFLGFILNTEFRDCEHYKTSLEAIGSFLFSGYEEKEKRRILSRYAEFCAREIELHKIHAHYYKNGDARNHLLFELFRNERQPELAEQYLAKLPVMKRSESAESGMCKKLRMFEERLNAEIVNTRSIKSDKLTDELIQFQNQLEESYHISTQNILVNFLLRSFLMEDVQETEIERLFNLCSELRQKCNADSPLRIVYEACLALKFAENPTDFRYRIDLLQEKLEAIRAHRLFSFVQEKFLMVSVLINLLNGTSPETQKSDAKTLFEMGTGKTSSDMLKILPHLFLLCFEGRGEEVEKVMEENAPLFAACNDWDVVVLLHAYLHESMGQSSDAIRELQGVLNSPVYFISMMARLLEFKIFFERGDLLYCKNLYNRVKQYVAYNKYPPLGSLDIRAVLRVFRQLLSGKEVQMSEITGTNRFSSPFQVHLQDWLLKLKPVHILPEMACL